MRSFVSIDPGESAGRRFSWGGRLVAIVLASFGLVITGLPLGAGAALATALPSCSTTQDAPCVFGHFEVDGNTHLDGPAASAWDWETVPNKQQVDLAGTQADNSFKMGAKELDQSTWTCTAHKNPPNKADITNVWLANGTSDGKQYAYLSFLRNGGQPGFVQGNVHLDFEFNHATNKLTIGGCDLLPVRQDGDMVITFDADGGGHTFHWGAYRWTGGTWVALADSARGVLWDAAMNISPAFSEPGVTSGAFGEAVLNITDTMGSFNCDAPAAAWMKTRASHSIDAELKDLVTPSTFLPGGACPPPPANGTLEAKVYLCDDGVQTTTPEPGSFTFTGPQSGGGDSPLSQSVKPSPPDYTVHATAGTGFTLETCGSTNGTLTPRPRPCPRAGPAVSSSTSRPTHLPWELLRPRSTSATAAPRP